MTAPAEALRAAAKSLRETASKATPGPWTVSRIPGVGGSVDDPTLSLSIAVGTRWTSYGDGKWVALANPALAEPLAAWLGHVAETWAFCKATQRDQALAVARALNGATS
ncbi:hypothetical protein [Spirillospora sp. NBC_01491]|uniref:hypothetical protein n=1 Tax=Spirillospora sp. NBC_01491 TaxID=2976007 RepID=UPI002E32649C|nr:hypothetical protein [Spirillospora sp. NBC_01491]